MRAFGWLVVAVLATALPSVHAPTALAAGGIRLELNKLEPNEGYCRAYFLFANTSERRYDDVKFDIAIFDKQGIVLKRLAISAGTLRTDKRILKLFDIDGLACADIGEVLVNDMLSCESGGEPVPDCIDLVSVTSRAEAKVVK